MGSSSDNESSLSLSLPPPSFSLPEVWISREIKRRDKKRRRGEAEREREREGHAKHVGDPLEAPTWFRGILSAFCKQEDKGRRTGIKSAGVDTQPFWNVSSTLWTYSRAMRCIIYLRIIVYSEKRSVFWLCARVGWRKDELIGYQWWVELNYFRRLVVENINKYNWK